MGWRGEEEVGLSGEEVGLSGEEVGLRGGCERGGRWERREVGEEGGGRGGKWERRWEGRR